MNYQMWTKIVFWDVACTLMMPIRGSLSVCLTNKKRLLAAMLYSWSLEPELSRPGSCSAWAPNETVTGRASINTSQYNNKEGDSKKPYTIYYYTQPPDSTSTVTTPATTSEIWMRFEIEDLVSFICYFLFSPILLQVSLFTVTSPLRQKSELITRIVWQLLPGATWSKGSGFSINQFSD